MTMALSSSSRFPIITVELSLRRGTSGMLNRARSDHPCVTLFSGATACRHLTLTALEQLLVFNVPSILCLTSHDYDCHGGKCNTPFCGIIELTLHAGLITGTYLDVVTRY